MTKNPSHREQQAASNDARLAELRTRIEASDWTIDLIADYIMFCELGGAPTEYMREKATLTMEYIKAQQARSTQTSSTSAPNNVPFLPREPPQQESPSSSIMDGALVRDIATTIVSTMGAMAISYWQIKSFDSQAQVAESRIAAARAEIEAARLHEDNIRAQAYADQSRSNWNQMAMWSLAAAANFATDYSMERMRNQNKSDMQQFEALRERDREDRRSQRFDQLLIWGGTSALKAGGRYLLGSYS